VLFSNEAQASSDEEEEAYRDEDAPGGFMADDEPAAGGFIVDGDDAGPAQGDADGFKMPSFAREPDSDAEDDGDLPFARIVPALRSLRLPHDSEILDTFRAAADGDEGPDEETADDGLTVSRESFLRSVCATLT